MKKIVSFLLTILMVMGMLAAFPGVAMAADDLDMDVSYTPTTLMTGGEVKLTVNIKNNGDDVESAVLSVDGKTLAEFGNILSGGTKDYSGTITVGSNQIGKNISVVLNYTYGGEQKSISQTINIGKKEANVELSTAVKVDKDTVPYNTKVNFTFVVENQGDVEFENATITASALNGGKAISKPFNVKAGDTEMVTYTGTIMKTITVEPVLKFTAAGKSYSKKMDKITVTMSDASMEVELTADTFTPEPDSDVVFSIKLTNNGNVDFKNIKVLDSFDNKIPTDSASLKAGESMNAQTALSFTESKQVGFTVTAEDSSGQSYTFNSNVLDIQVAAATETPTLTVNPSEMLQLDIVTDRTKLVSDGIVTFTLTLKNNSGGALQNVVLSEKTMGNLETIADLAPGEQEFVKEVELKEDTKFVFSVTATDLQGNQIAVTSDEIEVTMDGKEAGDGIGTLLWVIGIILVLIIGTGVTLLILMNKEKKRKREEEALNAKRQAQARRNAANAQARTVRRAPVPTPPAREDLYDEASEQEELEEDYRSEFNTFDVEEPQENEDDLAEVELEEEPTVRRRSVTSQPKKVNRKADFDDRNNF